MPSRGGVDSLGSPTKSWSGSPLGPHPGTADDDAPRRGHAVHARHLQDRSGRRPATRGAPPRRPGSPGPPARCPSLTHRLQVLDGLEVGRPRPRRTFPQRKSDTTHQDPDQSPPPHGSAPRRTSFPTESASIPDGVGPGEPASRWPARRRHPGSEVSSGRVRCLRPSPPAGGLVCGSATMPPQRATVLAVQGHPQTAGSRTALAGRGLRRTPPVVGDLWRRSDPAAAVGAGVPAGG